MDIHPGKEVGRAASRQDAEHPAMQAGQIPQEGLGFNQMR